MDCDRKKTWRRFEHHVIPFLTFFYAAEAQQSSSLKGWRMSVGKREKKKKAPKQQIQTKVQVDCVCLCVWQGIVGDGPQIHG